MPPSDYSFNLKRQESRSNLNAFCGRNSRLAPNDVVHPSRLMVDPYNLKTGLLLLVVYFGSISVLSLNLGNPFRSRSPHSSGCQFSKAHLLMVHTCEAEGNCGIIFTHSYKFSDTHEVSSAFLLLTVSIVKSTFDDICICNSLTESP